ncbi:MAG: ATP-binding protein [bacterium]
MKKILKLLLVEDSKLAKSAIITLLQDNGYDPKYKGIETLQDLQDNLLRHSWDIILCDYFLPGFNGLDALKIYKNSELDIPFIIVSGKIDAETAVEAMKTGAHDYVLKNNLQRLIPTIERELHEYKQRQLIKEERLRLLKSLDDAQKLEAIGRLAAGIAHEINTPIQFIGDNLSFLGQSVQTMVQLISMYRSFLAECEHKCKASKRLETAYKVEKDSDLEFIITEGPKAVKQSIEGVGHITKIVQSMREFSHFSDEQKAEADINKAIENATVISKNEWKYVADLKTELDQGLPLVFCFIGDIKQVILNIIINAAHAIEESVKNKAEKGLITITSKQEKESILISISDTGAGIAEDVQGKIFEPFFTTKGVGKGTGQGLAMAYSTIVEKHRGTLTFESIPGKGTTFFIRLPR